MSEKLLLAEERQSVSREFVRAWRAWQNTPPPVNNFRLGRDDAPTFAIESDLDHLCTWLYGLGTAVLEGRKSNFARMAVEDLAELWRIELELERVAIPEKFKRHFRRYFALTRLLLDEILRCQQTAKQTDTPPQ